MALKNRIRYTDQLVLEDERENKALVKELKKLQLGRIKGNSRMERICSGYNGFVKWRSRSSYGRERYFTCFLESLERSAEGEDRDEYFDKPTELLTQPWQMRKIAAQVNEETIDTDKE